MLASAKKRGGGERKGNKAWSHASEEALDAWDFHGGPLGCVVHGQFWCLLRIIANARSIRRFRFHRIQGNRTKTKAPLVVRFVRSFNCPPCLCSTFVWYAHCVFDLTTHAQPTWFITSFDQTAWDRMKVQPTISSRLSRSVHSHERLLRRRPSSVSMHMTSKQHRARDCKTRMFRSCLVRTTKTRILTNGADVLASSREHESRTRALHVVSSGNPNCSSSREETLRLASSTKAATKRDAHGHRRLVSRALARRMHAPGDPKSRRRILPCPTSWKTVLLALVGALSAWIVFETYGA